MIQVEYCNECTLPNEYCELLECAKINMEKDTKGQQKKIDVKINALRKRGHHVMEIVDFIDSKIPQEIGEKKIHSDLRKKFACSVKICVNPNLKKKVIQIHGNIDKVNILAYLCEMTGVNVISSKK